MADFEGNQEYKGPGGELTTAEEAFVQNFAGLSHTSGDVYYYNSGIQRLPKGSDTQVLTLVAGLPAWAAAAAGYTDEQVDDRVSALIQNGTGITWSYDDVSNTLTGNVSITQYTDEQAQDAVGGMVDTSLVYVDGTPLLTRAALTGDVTAPQGSNSTTIASDAVTYAKMQNVSTNNVVLGRITAGPGDVEELTAANLATIANASFDHGALLGLADDDHTQYPLLAGRSGGQTIYGSTVTAQNLTLIPNSAAANGFVYLGTDAAYSASSGGLFGIGTQDPQRRLHVVASDTLGVLAQVVSNTTGASVGYMFKTANGISATYMKGGVFFERSATGSGLGTLHLCVNGAADASNVTITDFALSITEGKLVGIGTKTPSYLLHAVESAVSAKQYIALSKYDNTAANFPTFLLQRSKGTVDTPVNVAASNTLGELRFEGYYSGFVPGASIIAQIPSSLSGTGGVGVSTNLLFKVNDGANHHEVLRLTWDYDIVMGEGDGGSSAVVNGVLRGVEKTGTNAGGEIFTIRAPKGTGTGALGLTRITGYVSRNASGTSAHTAVTLLQFGQTQSGHPGESGVVMQAPSVTWQNRNTSGSGTAANQNVYSFHEPTFTASNANVTVTDGATVWIEGAPIASTNISITNAYSLFLKTGRLGLGGAGTANQVSAMGSVFQLKASTVNGSNASGTIAIGATASIGITTYTNDNATLTMTNVASLYIAGVPVASTRVAFTNAAYALWIDAGTSRFDGALDISAIAAGSPNLVITKTTDAPTTVWTAGVPNNNPSGYIEITEGGGSKYIPFWT